MSQDTIGSIHAHILYDYHYGSSLKVTRSGDECLITLYANGAVGGMDGPGGSTPFAPTKSLRCPANASALVKCIKHVIARESPDIIKRYGKPSKNFQWPGVGAGLSVRMATLALARWEQRAQLLSNGESQV